MKMWKLWLALLVVCSSAHAATLLGVTDAEGFTWARVAIVNNSETDSNWSISGGRTAIASTDSAAEVDAQFDWDGVVAAGSSEYVWVYGRDLAEVVIANADGGVAEFYGTTAVDGAGDGEVVVVVNADGTTAVSVEAVDAYSAPAVTGALPE